VDSAERSGIASLAFSALGFTLWWYVVLTADMHASLRGVAPAAGRVIGEWIALALFTASLLLFLAAIMRGCRRWFVWLTPLLLLAILPTQLLGG